MAIIFTLMWSLIPDTGLAKDSVVLLEQIRTLDKHRLRERAGQITAADQKRVDQALDVSLGLSSY